jgi:DNA (cytosine-5)-methyltransferase 1
MTMKVIDLFSGPGGLGEGFASLENGSAFHIEVSAEMDTAAHSTLVLRAFFRLAKKSGDRRALESYYAFCNSPEYDHPSISTPLLWEAARQEARQLTLGDPASNETLDNIISKQKLGGDDTILIGGPPCQAYSLVGRARNNGKADYIPEDDHRHYLYRQYLRIVGKTRPAAFVMENVKGILSSTVGGRRIFHDILNDLRDPVLATTGKRGPRYVIHSLSSDTKFEEGMNPSDLDPRDFIVKAEEYGIPQARHRVILLGVREDIVVTSTRLRKKNQVTVRDALIGIPRLRSGLSKDDSPMEWAARISSIGGKLADSARAAGMNAIAESLNSVRSSIDTALDTGALRYPKNGYGSSCVEPSSFSHWVADTRIKVWLNHVARPHMDSDLGRYLYASVYASVTGRSPRGHTEFALPDLAPAHANWKSGKFVDRFKVQRFDQPSSTITSHISKDGHYFIHPDPLQCRSLSAREAARLQTFPDNYFFQGGRTQQFHQVGNAVPPLLANRIAATVRRITSQ